MINRLIRNILSKVQGSDWEQHYAEIKALATKDELIGSQEKYLKKLLLHVYHNVPCYTQLFRELGIARCRQTQYSGFC